HLDEAESLIRRALALEPQDGFFVDSLGWVYYRRGDFRRAVEELERAVELAGDDPTVAEHLGDAYERVGQPRDALRLYRDALGRAKENPQIERLKGKIHALEDAARGEGGGLWGRGGRGGVAAGLVAVLVLAGCALRSPRPRLRPATAEELLAGLTARRMAVTSLRGRARLRAGLRGAWTRQAILVRRPAAIRIDV